MADKKNYIEPKMLLVEFKRERENLFSISVSFSIKMVFS